MIQTGDLVLELHLLMEVGSWERKWEPRKAHPSWQSDFLLPAKSHEGYCSNNLEKTLQMHGPEGAASVTGYSTSPWSRRGKGAYYRKRY